MPVEEPSWRDVNYSGGGDKNDIESSIHVEYKNKSQMYVNKGVLKV